MDRSIYIYCSSCYAVYQGLEGAAVAFYSTGIPAAIALYANRQYQNRKYEELKTVSSKNSNDNLEKDWDKVK